MIETLIFIAWFSVAAIPATGMAISSQEQNVKTEQTEEVRHIDWSFPEC